MLQWPRREEYPRVQLSIPPLVQEVLGDLIQVLRKRESELRYLAQSACPEIEDR